MWRSLHRAGGFSTSANGDGLRFIMLQLKCLVVKDKKY